ncbi:MAG TPA: cupin domain-containing protein [Thermoleophilaceae bacterium]|nr:cupin domain-containing protein [Thermoleophilaceae bacterium]
MIEHAVLTETAATDWFVDQVASVLAEDADDGRRPVLAERTAGGGKMPPLHTRDEGEAYRVTQGIVTFFVGDETVSAAPGDVVVAPAGLERSFRVESDRATWFVLTHVRSLARFDDFNRAVSEPVGGGWPSLEEAATVASIASVNDIELVGPPGALPG